MGSEHFVESCAFLDVKEQLIKENRNYWKAKSNITQGNQWIYVYHGMSSDHFDWAVHENIVAKGLQAKTGFPITSVIDGFGHALPEGLDESFGIVDSAHMFYSKYADKSSEESTETTAKEMAEATYKDKDKLLQLEYRGIKFGNELYDHLLFKNWQKDEVSFDCFDLSLERYIHDIRAALSLIDQAFAMFTQRRPAYVITAEKILLKSLLGNVAKVFGAKEIIILNDWPETLVQIPPETTCGRVTVSDISITAVQSHLKCMKTALEKEDDLFVIKGKKGTETYDFQKKLGISNSNMNVFIFPHAFIDAPREGCQLNFYRDYFEWFLETINIIKKIPNVNWIIKDHPETAYYKQGPCVKRVFQENKMSNIYWCDSDVSGMYIKEFADCLVTCGGEAALEYWAYGIPTITTARTGFLMHGISYNMGSEEEYINALKNIAEIKKPSEESSKSARAILLAMKQMSHGVTQDALAQLYLEVRKIQLNGYRSGLSFQHIPAFCKGYMTLLKEGLLEQSCIYQMKNVCEIL